MTDAYRELGWEYVCTLAGTFHVWRCGDPDAPELDTDPVVQSMGYGYLKKKMRRRLLRLPAILLVCLGICVLPWVWGAGDMPLVDQLDHALPGEGLFWLLMAAAAVGFELLDAFRMRCLLRSLSTGVPLERPRSWWLQKRVTQATMVLGWAGLMVSLFSSPRAVIPISPGPPWAGTASRWRRWCMWICGNWREERN